MPHWFVTYLSPGSKFKDLLGDLRVEVRKFAIFLRGVVGNGLFPKGGGVDLPVTILFVVGLEGASGIVGVEA